MAAGKVKLYELTSVRIGDGTFELDDNTNWRIALLLSSSNANTLSVGTAVYGDLTNEHANANGYTTGGVAITPTWTRSGATATFDAADLAPGWTAAGGNIVARFGVVYKNATVNAIVKPLFGVFLLEAVGPADVTATNGNPFNVTWNATGLYAITAPSAD